MGFLFDLEADRVGILERLVHRRTEWLV